MAFSGSITDVGSALEELMSAIFPTSPEIEHGWLKVVSGLGVWMLLLVVLACISLFAVRRLPHDLTVEAAVSHRVLLGVLKLDTPGFLLHWQKSHLFQALRAS